MKYGLVGKKLPHSFSKEIHEMLGSYEYELIEVDEKELVTLLREKSFSALNVTIPYKETVIGFLDEIDLRAEEIGAVNTIVNKNGRLCGYNTDYLGLRALIEKNGVSVAGKTALILGTGGTSKTALKILKDMGAKEVHRVSRNSNEGAISYEDAYKNFSSAEIIINTTPVGMYPNISSTPIDLSKFSSLTAVFDAVYNPIKTDLVLNAQSKKITAEGGLYMLVAQAVFASELFLNKKYEPSKINKVYDKILGSKLNIVLSGMPGSGKTTLGKLVAEKTGRKFIDTDEIIVKDEGREITEIFAISGEDYFRNKESEVIKKYSEKADNLVIALGGGAVLREENVRSLKRNGRIYFLNRPLEDIEPTDDRPLSKSRELLEKRFCERYRIYTESADKEIKVNSSAEDIAEIIRKDFCSDED